MEKLDTEFGPTRPSDDRAVDTEHASRVSHLHAKKQEFDGRQSLGALEATAIDRQVKNRSRSCAHCPGDRGREENGDSRLATPVVRDTVRRHDLLGMGKRRSLLAEGQDT